MNLSQRAVLKVLSADWAFNVFWYEEDNLFSGKRFTLIHNSNRSESNVLVNCKFIIL